MNELNIYNCRIFENEIFRQDWRSAKKVQVFQYVVLKWAFALLIGIVTGVVGFFNNIAVENIAGFKLLLTTALMSDKKYVNQQKWRIEKSPFYFFAPGHQKFRKGPGSSVI